LILYRKTTPLRIKHAAAPEPPFWFATAIAPYSPRRSSPISIDFLDLTATLVERAEVQVCESVKSEIERAARLDEPLLIEASEFAELIFRRGEEALALAEANGIGALHLVSTRGAVPKKVGSDTVVAISAWPLEFDRLEKLFDHAKSSKWGVVVPVMHPVTTHLPALAQLADLARKYEASFFSAIAIELDATAKQEIAKSDEDAYEVLFHGDAAALHLATERHIAALAAEREMSDFVTPPRWDRKSNWNAAILLTLTAARMIAMEHDVELAGTIARSARAVAALEKPIERIAEAASLSIIESLDEVSVDLLSEWLESGRATYAERVNQEWRLRRDAGMNE
jgi:hypothetical protein